MKAFGNAREIYKELEDGFRYRYKNPDGSQATAQLVGFLFAPEGTSLAKDKILPRLDEYHFRTGDELDIFFAGYMYVLGEEMHDEGFQYLFDDPESFLATTIERESGVKTYWGFSAKDFEYARQLFVKLTNRKWNYSGEVDMLLTVATFDSINERVNLEFKSFLQFKLEEMLKDDAIMSSGYFFESLFQLAESMKGEDALQYMRDQKSIEAIVKSLWDIFLDKVPGVRSIWKNGWQKGKHYQIYHA